MDTNKTNNKESKDKEKDSVTKKETDVKEEKEEKSTNSCETHGLELCFCSSCNKTLCKLCVFENKEELKHLKDHYDYILDLIPSNKKYQEALHDYEGFELLNKVYIEKLEKADEIIDSSFEKIHASKYEIISRVKTVLQLVYDNLTSNFEKYVKSVSSNINSLDINDVSSKEEFKKLKKKFDDLSEFLDNEEKLKELFNNITQKALAKFDKLKVSDLASDNLPFKLGSSGESLDLIGGDGNKLTTKTGKSGTYYIARSDEVLEGEFLAKIKINKIDSSKVNSYLKYSVGVIKKSYNSTTNYDTYLNDSVVFQSNGYMAKEFSNSSSYKKILDLWKAGDVLLIKRDASNDLYFGINEEKNLVKATNHSGELRVVIGVSTSNFDDEFELIEISKF